MKNLVVLLVACVGLLISFGAEAQLKVVSSGDVGVGVSSPDRKLHVAGINGIARIDRSGSSAPGFLLANTRPNLNVEKAFFFGVPASATNNGYFYIGDYGTATSGIVTRRLVVDNDGDVIIGSTTNISDGYKLRVEGSAFKTDGQSQWNIISDLKTKSSVDEFEMGLDEILKLKPVLYTYNGKAGTEKGSERVGIVAQDLRKVFPHMVEEFTHYETVTPEDVDGDDSAMINREEKFLSINTSSLQWVLVNAVKDQQDIIDSQTEAIEDLQDEIAHIKEMIAAGLSSTDGQELNATLSIGEDVGDYKLEQNAPNPWSNETVINFEVPENVTSASIEFFSNKGELLKAVKVAQGESTIRVNGENIPSGTYNYALRINGDIVETKRMTFIQK